MKVEDYLVLHKDEELTKDTLTDVDAAFLSTFALLDIKNVLPQEGESASLNSVINKQIDKIGIKKLGLLVPKYTMQVFAKCKDMIRFKDLRVFDAFSFISDEEETQTNVFQLELADGTICIIFGSTDDSIVGWMENLNISCRELVPCLKYSFDYVTKHYNENKEYIFIGHSKGGMESLYCGLNCKYRDEQILNIYDFDGPGFLPHINEELKKSNRLEKVKFFCPEESVVGRFFSQPLEPVIVKSRKHSVMQHHPSYWVVEENSFEITKKFNELANLVPKRVNFVTDNINKEKADLFIRKVFQILYSKNNKTLTDAMKNIMKCAKEYFKMPFMDKLMLESIIAYLISERLVTKKQKEKFIQ